MVRKIVALVVIVTFVAIDFLEFHDLLEPKTVPEILTGLVSVPVLVLMGMDLFRGGESG